MAVSFAALGASSIADAESIHATFRCADGKDIAAVFDNGANARVRLALSDGRKLALPQARSGSGARYANHDESIVFWNKGDTAFIEERGKTTYRDCVAATRAGARPLAATRAGARPSS